MGKLYVGRLDPEGYSFTRAIQPLHHLQCFRLASPVHECSGSREIELSKTNIRVARYLFQLSGCAPRLQPVRIKGHGVERALHHVDEMTARKDPRVQACIV